MKILLILICLLFTLVACATGGTSVGNGLAPIENKVANPATEIKNIKEYCEVKKAGKYTNLKCVLKDNTLVNEAELVKEFQTFIKK